MSTLKRYKTKYVLFHQKYANQPKDGLGVRLIIMKNDNNNIYFIIPEGNSCTAIT